MASSDHHFTAGKTSDTLYSSKLDPSKSSITTGQEYSYFGDPHSYFYSPIFSQNKHTVESQNFQASTSYVYSTHIPAAKLATTQLENFMEEDEIHRVYLTKTLPQLNTDRLMNRKDESMLRHDGYFSFDTSQADQALFTPYFGNEQKVDESYREEDYNHNLLSDLLSKHDYYTSLLDKKDPQENLQRLNNSFIDRQANFSSVDFGAPLYNSAQYLSKLPSVNDCYQIIGDRSYTGPFLNETFSSSLEKNQPQTNLPESNETDKNWTEVEKKINKILEAVSNQSSYILPQIIEKLEKETPTSPTETTAGSLTSIKDESIFPEISLDINSPLIAELKDCVSKYRRDSNIVIGLKNSGLSCYINVILHCLLNAPLLAHYFLERYHDKERNSKSRGMISYIFGEMLAILNKHDNNLNNSDVAQDLNESASFLRLYMSWGLNPSFKRGNQNDAIEFLKMFLGEMSDELNRVTYKPAYQELSTALSTGESLQAKSQEWLRSLLVRENSIVSDLFGGQLLNTQYCRCSNKVSFDLFWDISLPINQKSTKFHTLEDLLRDYLQKEVLDKSCDCATCFSPTVLKTQLWRLPEILVFTFKRFRNEGTWQKIEDSVIFPVKNLDLSSFIEESSDKSVQNANYTLFGIVKHVGSLDDGHYTAECLNIFNQKWYQLNDDYVENSRLTKETELYSCEPSILFYIKNSSLCL